MWHFFLRCVECVCVCVCVSGCCILSCCVNRLRSRNIGLWKPCRLLLDSASVCGKAVWPWSCWFPGKLQCPHTRSLLQHSTGALLQCLKKETRRQKEREDGGGEKEETRAFFGSVRCRQDSASISPQTCLEARLAGIWPQVSSEIALALLETMTDAAALPEGTGTCSQFNVMKAGPVGRACPIRFTRRDCICCALADVTQM